MSMSDGELIRLVCCGKIEGSTYADMPMNDIDFGMRFKKALAGLLILEIVQSREAGQAI